VCCLWILQHAPGVPKVLIGNRLHLEFKRQVTLEDAEDYAMKHKMGFFEVSHLCNYNIVESFVELSRMALQRNGMERLWRQNKGTGNRFSICCTSLKVRESLILFLNQFISSVAIKRIMLSSPG